MHCSGIKNLSPASVYAQWCVFRGRKAGVKVVLTGRGPTNNSAVTGSSLISTWDLSPGGSGTFSKPPSPTFFFTGIDLRHSLHYFRLGRRLVGLAIIRPEAFPPEDRNVIAGTALLPGLRST
jgi:hypothetical protein